jgi:hypothetical protein
VRTKRRSHAIETRAFTTGAAPISFTPSRCDSKKAPEVLDARSLGPPAVPPSEPV